MPNQLQVIKKEFKTNNAIHVNDDKNLLDFIETQKQVHKSPLKVINETFKIKKIKTGYFQLHNRRYLGNKHKLLDFIEAIIFEKCGAIDSLCDIFAGTGVVGERFNNSKTKIISNDFLSANYVCLRSFLSTTEDLEKKIEEKIKFLNRLPDNENNYFYQHFGGTYFTEANARKIGTIREKIDEIADNEVEKSILLSSLIYAVDKAANTVGHYDAYRKKLDMVQPVKLLIPQINYRNNLSNQVFKEDANQLIRKIKCDVLYIDPPYNSRQYSDTYHLLENLAKWEKPKVKGLGKKMDRAQIKSKYCFKNAVNVFFDLIKNANCNHILLSYNNTGKSKNGRSNARITDEQIISILSSRGKTEIFEKKYKNFTTGRNYGENIERIFYCRVKKNI